MSDESALRQKAREAIHGGQIPGIPPERTWGGPGGGSRCAICGLVVKRDEMEFELEFAGADVDSAPMSYHVHIRCFAAWEFERHHVDPAGTAPRPNGHVRRSV